MAQLKLTLPTADVNEIRRLAHEQGLGVSEFMRVHTLGAREVELTPESVGRLDEMQSQLERVIAELANLRQVVSALDDDTEVVSLDRRLSRLEEMANF